MACEVGWLAMNPLYLHVTNGLAKKSLLLLIAAPVHACPTFAKPLLLSWSKKPIAAAAILWLFEPAFFHFFAWSFATLAGKEAPVGIGVALGLKALLNLAFKVWQISVWAACAQSSFHLRLSRQKQAPYGFHKGNHGPPKIRPYKGIISSHGPWFLNKVLLGVYLFLGVALDLYIPMKKLGRDAEPRCSAIRAHQW